MVWTNQFSKHREHITKSGLLYKHKAAHILKRVYILWYTIIQTSVNNIFWLVLKVRIKHFYMYSLKDFNQWNQLSVISSFTAATLILSGVSWASSFYQCTQAPDQRYQPTCPKDVWANHASMPPQRHMITPVIAWSYIKQSVSSVIFRCLINDTCLPESTESSYSSQDGRMPVSEWEGSQLPVWCLKGSK